MKTGFTKMKRLAAIGLFALSALSFANVETNGPLDEEMFTKEVHQNKNYFETLQGMFKKGTLPEPSKLLGVLWSGRCFEKESPYSPINGAYHLRRVKKPDVGPLGDDVVLYEAASVWAPSEAPNYYDKMELSEYLKDLESSNISYSRLYEGDGALVISLDFKGNLHEYLLRVSGKYLISKVFVYREGRKDNWFMCYYFIPEYK